MNPELAPTPNQDYVPRHAAPESAGLEHETIVSEEGNSSAVHISDAERVYRSNYQNIDVATFVADAQANKSSLVKPEGFGRAEVSFAPQLVEERRIVLGGLKKRVSYVYKRLKQMGNKVAKDIAISENPELKHIIDTTETADSDGEISSSVENVTTSGRKDNLLSNDDPRIAAAGLVQRVRANGTPAGNAIGQPQNWKPFDPFAAANERKSNPNN
jgi:hypothetical protein